MDENNIPGENREAEPKKEAVPPTVEYLPDLDGAQETETQAAPPPREQERQTATEHAVTNTTGETDAPRKVKPVAVKKAERKGVSVGTFVTVVILCVIATFMTTYVFLLNSYGKQLRDFQMQYSASAENELSALSAKLNAIDAEIRQGYLYDIDEEQLEDSVLKGYLRGIGDKYAEYFNKDEMAQLVDDSNGEMQGIGVSVVYNADMGAIEIINVYPDSPAIKAGIKSGDLIAYIIEDDEYVSVQELGYTMALSKLRGEAGTVARFVVYRDENYDEPIEFSIERGYVTEYTVTYRFYEADKTVGIINISSFDSKTPGQFKAALDALISGGAEKLVFDVRYNPGGELESVCSVLDMLLPEGPVIRTVDKDGNEETVYVSDSEEINLPMAVIANGGTASAGELFTAALRDYNKAVIVGEKTYGKGSMQTIRSFNDGTGFKYTYRYYCPPYSDNYDGVGITPDTEVKLSEEAAKKNIYTLTDGEDDQLRAAVDSLK